MISDETLLDRLQRAAFGYFLQEVNPANGLIADTSRENSPASIAVVGFALSAYPVAVERGWMTRAEAVDRSLSALRFFRDSDQSGSPDATGYKGFYYHFLDMHTGARVWRSELSMVDTALLIAGALTGEHVLHRRHAATKSTLRELADALYRRVDWRWAQGGERDDPARLEAGMRIPALRLGGLQRGHRAVRARAGLADAPDRRRLLQAWTATYQWENLYGYDFLYAGPLFMHQFSHAWIDFRGIRDRFMREKRCDYFENSRRATYVQREYARRNPHGFAGYDENCWGLTACDGPSDESLPELASEPRRLFGYAARGVPYGPDDGTARRVGGAGVAAVRARDRACAPRATCCSAIPRCWPRTNTRAASIRPSPTADRRAWVSAGHFGLDQGIVRDDDRESSHPTDLAADAGVSHMSRPDCGAPDSAAAGCSGLLHGCTTMQQLNDPSSTAPNDAYERERLDNVHPAEWRNPQPAGRYNLVVVGAGTAGLVAAHAAAALGAKVALIERNLLGGNCLNIGCVPSKTIIRTSRLYAEMRQAEQYGARSSGRYPCRFFRGDAAHAWLFARASAAPIRCNGWSRPAWMCSSARHALPEPMR